MADTEASSSSSTPATTAPFSHPSASSSSSSSHRHSHQSAAAAAASSVSGEVHRGARSRGRPRVRSPESARRFQRECIRQMQATRVYLGTAYQRWRSLSILFKRTSDMAKHLLDVHERHCTACFQPNSASHHYPPLMPHHRQHRQTPNDGVRLLNEIQRMSSMRSHQLQKHNDDPSPTLPEDISIKMETSNIDPASCLVSVLPEISCYIKQEPSTDDMSYDEAIDLTRESSGSSAVNNFNNSAT